MEVTDLRIIKVAEAKTKAFLLLDLPTHNLADLAIASLVVLDLLVSLHSPVLPALLMEALLFLDLDRTLPQVALRDELPRIH